MNELIPTLVQMKKDRLERIEKKSSDVIEKFFNKGNEIDKSEFIEVVPHAKMIMEEIKKDIGIAKKHINNITTIAIQHQSAPNVKDCEVALKNGVKITMIIEKPCNGKTLPKYTMELTKYPNFILRFIPSPSKVKLVIEDDKKLWLMTSDDDFYKSSWLVTSNRHLLALASDYFNRVLIDSSPFL